MYKQAILDAKAIRATAIANAKASIQEVIEPRIQEMMKLKLSEEFDEDYTLEDEGMTAMEEDVRQGVFNNFQKWKASFPEGTEFESKNNYMVALNNGEELGKWNPISGMGMHSDDPQYKTLEEGPDDMHDANDEIQDDVSAGVDEYSLDEILAELEALEEEESLQEAEDKEDDKDDDEEGEMEDEIEDAEEDEISDDDLVVELTVGQLKKIFADIKAEESTSEIPAGEDFSDEEPMEPEEGEEEIKEVSLEEILAELEEDSDPDDDQGSENSMHMKSELYEAKRTIKNLSETLAEINLLNAKLLYMNKVLKGNTLSEQQKIKVVKAFDRAESVKEVKNTYETLQESLSSKNAKQTIKESIGFASKPAGIVQKTQIVEADDFVKRWQKIAGIK